MAIVAWLTVITGTWIVYPWYRAAPPEGTTDLSTFPRSLLLSSESTEAWHRFGMEWKEHVAWIAPFLATSVAFVILYYGVQLIRRQEMRGPLLTMFTLAFVAAGIAGMFGAFITKAAPVY
jgi:predicted membrane protein